MPNSPQLTSFCNTRVRPTSDIGESMYNTAVRFISEYNSFGITQMVSDMQNTDIITDGAATDGRKSLSVKDLKDTRDYCTVIKTWYETVNASVANRKPIDLVVGSSVNGQSKF